MEYIKLFWEDAPEGEPPVILYEVDTEKKRLGRRSIDIFTDGRIRNIPELYDGAVEITPIPTVEEMNGGIWGEGFHACLMGQAEFEAVWESKDNAERIERGLDMNEKLFRPQFNKMDITEKQALMERLAAQYHMNLLRVETFSRWGQSCTTGLFEKNGREFVFVPGDTVTIGWDGFAEGLDEDNQAELDYIFGEMDYTGTAEDFIREDMMPPHAVTVGPMLVGRKPEEIGWEPVPLTDPRLRPEWLAALRDYAEQRDGEGLELVGRVRFRREGDGWQASLCHVVEYPKFVLDLLWEQGAVLPTAEEWAYLCGGGCRTLFPWGDGLDYSMRLYWFEDMEDTEDEERPYDLEEPNFFGLSIAYDPYIRELVEAPRLTTCGGDGGRSICGGLGPLLGYLPCSPHRRPETQEDNKIHNNYDFYRPVIRVDLD